MQSSVIAIHLIGVGVGCCGVDGHMNWIEHIAGHHNQIECTQHNSV